MYEELQKQERLELVEKVRFLYVFSIVVVPRTGGKLQLYIDFREVNKIAKADYYPLPRIEDVLAIAAGYEYTSLLDLVLGFNQLNRYLVNRHKLAFITPIGPIMLLLRPCIDNLII